MALPNTIYRWRGLWVNGADYSNYDTVRSPADGQPYVLDNGNVLAPSIVDPSLDPLWKLITTATAPFTPVFGSFSSTVTQPFAVNPLFTPIEYDTADIPPQGVGCIFPSPVIDIQTTGVYKVLTSIQMNSTGGGTRTADMWVSVNGVAVPNSATQIAINQNQEVVMTVEWFLALNATDRVAVNATAVVAGPEALAVPAAPPVPAIPSIITTITRIA